MAEVKNRIQFEFVTKGDKSTIKSIKKVGTTSKKATKDVKGFDNAIGGTVLGLRNLRNQTKKSAGTFSVFRSKLLLATFAVGLYARSIGKAVDKASQQEIAERKLKQAIKSTGREASISSSELIGLASALQDLTTFGDESIIEAQALLLTFTKIGKQTIPDATEAILNISAAMGQDLKQTTIQVGKALNDPIQGMSALRRVGIQLSEEQQDQVKSFMAVNDVASAQNIIIEELGVQFGGMAKSITKTVGGAMLQAKNAFGDLLEEIGRKITPVVAAMAEEVSKFAFQMKDPAEQYILSLRRMGVEESFIAEERKKISRDRLSSLLEENESIGITLDENTNLQDLMKRLNFEIKENNNVIKTNAEIYGEKFAKLREVVGAEEDAVRAVEESQAAGIRWTKHAGIINEHRGAEASHLADTIVRTSAHTSALEDETAEYALIIEALREYMIMLGLVAKPAEAMTGISKSLGAELSKSFEILFQPDKTGGEKWKDFILMILDMYQGVILASGAVNTALKHIFDPITGAANIVASLFMLEAAKAGVRSIKFAATGMDEIVTKPTMIIAGEAGAERVNVTPLNRTTAPAGGGGAGITVNISAPLVDETVVDSIIPAIKRAERMNLA